MPDITTAAGDAAGASLQFTTMAGAQFYEVAILHSDGSNDEPLVPTCHGTSVAEPGCVVASAPVGSAGAKLAIQLPLGWFRTLGGAFRFGMRAVLASSGAPGAWSSAEPAGAPVGVGTPLTWGPVAVASTSDGGCALQFDPVLQADSYVVEVLDQAGRVVATVPIPAEKLSTCGFKL